MTEHRHRWRIMFVTHNVHARRNGSADYWYEFTCHDWRCRARRTVNRGKFWAAS